jgi:ribose 5-phosphate isomerase B
MIIGGGSKTVLIASDHAGVELKSALQQLVEDLDWKDLGPIRPEPSVDYPDFAKLLCQAIEKGEAPLGVLICGSGIGMSIAANRHPGIRAALVENPISAKLAREHNHANVLCLGARFVAPHYAAEMIKAWILAEPSKEPRHLNRILKLSS